MADKKFYTGPDGAIFVPRVDDATIKVMVKSGEWKPATPDALVAHAEKVAKAQEARASRAIGRATEVARVKAVAEAAAQAAIKAASTPEVAGEPRGNGSTKEWAAYAASLGVEVPDGATRDEIKDLVAASAVPES